MRTMAVAWLIVAFAITPSPTLAQTDPLARADSLKQEVDRLYLQGRYREAIPKASEILALREQALGPTHPDVAQSLNNLAVLLQATGGYATARPLLERALRINEEALGHSHPLVARGLNNLAALLQDMGDYAGAKPLYERALRINEQALGPAHPHVATSLSNLAGLLRATGDYAAARPLFERALRIREQVFGPSHPDVAQSLNNLAGLLWDTGDYVGAMPLTERALRIQEQVLGPTHPDVARGLNNLAFLLQDAGDHTAARPLYERALRIQEQVLGPTHPDVAQSLNNLAGLLRATGDYAAARPLYERALQIREKALGPAHPVVAHSLNDLALLLQDTGDYAAARPLLERALHITEATLGPTHPDVATRLNNLAGLLKYTGDYTAAAVLYDRALRIKEKVHGPTHPSVAVGLNNLGSLFQTIGDYAAARPLYERALKIFEQALGPSHPHVAVSLNNLAELLMATGDYAAARPLHDRALRIKEQVLGPSHPDVGLALNNLAHLLHSIGDHAEARPLYERALKIFEQALGPDHPGVASILRNLAIVDWEAGHPQEAVAKLGRAVAIARSHTAGGLVGLSHRQKLAFLETTSRFTDSLVSLPPGRVPSADAYGAVLDRKNMLFRTLAAERSATDSNPSPQTASLIQDYTAVRRQLSILAISLPNPPDLPRYRTDIADLTQRLEALEGDLSRASAVFREAQMEATAGPSEICAMVPVNAALIDLFWYERYVPPAAPGAGPVLTPNYAVFILRGGDCEKPVRVDLGPTAPIDDDVRRFREAISREAPDPVAQKLRARYRQALAARLKAKLFPPEVQAAIAGKSRLLISPDGTLALLPFVLLPGDDGHEFLLETRTINYVPSGRDLLRVKAQSPAASGILAVGAPAFDRAPVQVAQGTTYRAGCGSLEDPFAPLPGTAAEVRAIIGVYQQTNPTRPATVLEGTKATKAAFLEQTSKASVLHLATHAYFAGEDCTPAGLVSEQRRIGTQPPAFLGYNPLLLAGIALTGANERDKANGIMTALEVTSLDLRGTSLVVLSACDTGLGTTVRGQELLGLRWAFAYAGARHLVTSLWSVPDAETATLMTHFYTALWEKGLSVSEALRVAQLEMLKAARARGDSAPHTWGAFVASGRPD